MASVTNDIPSLSVSGEVVVIGEVNLGTVYYSTLASTLILEGCGSVIDALVFTISSSELAAHQGLTTVNVPLSTTCPNKNITGVPIVIQTSDQCRKANFSVDVSNPMQLALMVTVKDKCNHMALWWYIVAGLLGVLSTLCVLWFVFWKCKCFRRGLTGVYHKLSRHVEPEEHEMEEHHSPLTGPIKKAHKKPAKKMKNKESKEEESPPELPTDATEEHAV